MAHAAAICLYELSRQMDENIRGMRLQSSWSVRVSFASQPQTMASLILHFLQNASKWVSYFSTCLNQNSIVTF